MVASEIESGDLHRGGFLRGRVVPLEKRGGDGVTEHPKAATEEHFKPGHSGGEG